MESNTSCIKVTRTAKGSTAPNTGDAPRAARRTYWWRMEFWWRRPTTTPIRRLSTTSRPKVSTSKYECILHRRFVNSRWSKQTFWTRALTKWIQAFNLRACSLNGVRRTYRLSWWRTIDGVVEQDETKW